MSGRISRRVETIIASLLVTFLRGHVESQEGLKRYDCVATPHNMYVLCRISRRVETDVAR